MRSPIGSFVGISQIASLSPLVIEYENKFFKVGPISADVPPNLLSYRFIYADENLIIAKTSKGGTTIAKKVLR